ncbi:hypothetical protein VTN02DRAFT_2313 [Thermoascus thermophilus]
MTFMFVVWADGPSTAGPPGELDTERASSRCRALPTSASEITRRVACLEADLHPSQTCTATCREVVECSGNNIIATRPPYCQTRGSDWGLGRSRVITVVSISGNDSRDLSSIPVIMSMSFRPAYRSRAACPSPKTPGIRWFHKRDDSGVPFHSQR